MEPRAADEHRPLDVALPAVQLIVGALVDPAVRRHHADGRTALARARAVLLALGLGGTGLAYVLFWRVMSIAGATVAASVTYVIPVVSTALGVIVLHEGLHWYELVGGAIVLSGVALTQWGAARRRRAARGRPGRAPERRRRLRPG